MQIIIVFIGLTLLVSCKAKKSVLESAANESLAAAKIIDGHYENKKEFSNVCKKNIITDISTY